MIDVDPGIVCRLIELAREFHAQETVTIDEEPASFDEDWQSHALAEHSGDPVLGEFRSVVDDLNPDEQQQVVALMWLGRGDYDLEEWDDALEYAAEAWNESTGDYLIAHPLVAEHLETGLEQQGYSCD